MSRQDQIGILKRLLHYVDTRTTAMADAPWQNDVSVYTDTEHLSREQRMLFRRRPILMGFGTDWATPGAFRTDDYAGVPVLIVRGRDGKPRISQCVPAPRRQGGPGLRQRAAVLMPLSRMDL